MLIVGVTGSVGSGKTTVSRMFEKEGAYVIDADQIARELVQPRRIAWREIVRAFGSEILDKEGSIDRRRLAGIAFSSPPKREMLNKILHPRIKREMERRARAIGQKDPEAIVIFDVPLLVETGYHRDMDQIVVVTSSEKKQIERMKKRVGMDEEETRRIISSQMKIEEKMKAADFVIRNEGSLKTTRRRVRKVFQDLRRIALQKGRGTLDLK